MISPLVTHRFPQNESAPKPERISEVGCRQFDTELALKPGSAKAKSTTLTVQAVSTGGMTCWLSLKPHTITLEEATVDKYLKEIAASEEIRATWANAPQPRAWTETYSKHAKLIIPGSRTLPQSIRLIGAELEFVPGIDLLPAKSMVCCRLPCCAVASRLRACPSSWSVNAAVAAFGKKLMRRVA